MRSHSRNLLRLESSNPVVIVTHQNMDSIDWGSVVLLIRLH